MKTFTRREWLARSANGIGSVALATMLAEQSRAAPLHHAAKAKSIIFLYMDGGVSQVDSFDPKPLLDKHHGEDPHKAIGKLEPTQFANVGKVMKSPWKFAQHGQSGLWVSDLFPHVAKCADDLAVIRSMVSKFPEHTTANYFLHTGSGQQGRPSWGAWCGYGLGSDNKNLPGFIVLNGGLVPPAASTTSTAASSRPRSKAVSSNRVRAPSPTFQSSKPAPPNSGRSSTSRALWTNSLPLTAR